MKYWTQTSDADGKWVDRLGCDDVIMCHHHARTLKIAGDGDVRVVERVDLDVARVPSVTVKRPYDMDMRDLIECLTANGHQLHKDDLAFAIAHDAFKYIGYSEIDHTHRFIFAVWSTACDDGAVLEAYLYMGRDGNIVGDFAAAPLLDHTKQVDKLVEFVKTFPYSRS